MITEGRVWYDEDNEDDELKAKLAVIHVLCGLGYWVMHKSDIDHNCPFTVHWNHTEEKLRKQYYDFFSRGGVLHRPTGWLLNADHAVAEPSRPWRQRGPI